MQSNDIKGKPEQDVRRQNESTEPARQFLPVVDIYEDDQAVTVVAEMPGVGRDDLEIQLEEGILTISGTAPPPDTSGETSLIKEFEFGRYIRKFTLSETIDQEKVEATVVNGMLYITLPKIEPSQPRKIDVQEG